MKKKLFWFCAALAALLSSILIDPALASEPFPWQKGLQPAASPVMERIDSFHDMLLYVITAISVFVLALMLFICVRFSARVNPKPSKTTHNTAIEVIWTAIPVIILILIAIPSMKLLYYADRTADPEMTVKVTGYQWYWGYEYLDHDGLSFNAYMIQDEDIDESKGQVRLLSTDNQLVLPIDTNIKILVTAADVLHALAVPAFGVKIDAVPGRTNETWTRITKPGTYYGQCSELCGKDHAYMPVEIRAVPKEEFEAWVEFAQEQYASYDAFKEQYQTKLAQLGDQ